VLAGPEVGGEGADGKGMEGGEGAVFPAIHKIPEGVRTGVKGGEEVAAVFRIGDGGIPHGAGMASEEKEEAGGGRGAGAGPIGGEGGEE